MSCFLLEKASDGGAWIVLPLCESDPHCCGSTAHGTLGAGAYCGQKEEGRGIFGTGRGKGRGSLGK